MERNVIIEADCADFLREVPNEAFDAILTDPPYGVTKDNDDYVATFFLKEAYRVLKPNSALMMCVGQATLRQFWNAAEAEGFRWLNTIVWHYKNTFKRERRRFAIQYDPILYFCKGEDYQHQIDAVRVPYEWPDRLRYATNNKKMRGWMPNPEGAICGDVWEFPAVTNSANPGSDRPLGHKWQKPLFLFERMVRATLVPGQLMCDPFCGSGTACIAARDYRVDFVGIDNDPESVKIARERLKPPPKEMVDIFAQE